MTSNLIDFKIEKISPSIIMVAGVGGGGSNAVNHMYELGIAEVTFMVCNTDRQALAQSPVPLKVKLGNTLTEGLGAGNSPEKGREAGLESLDEIVSVFQREGIKMLFITAGMGGGTGTGAAPIIAKAAREMGILTVGIVTMPFLAEGKRANDNAMYGIQEMRQSVDSLLVINNENIKKLYGDLALREAFRKADGILAAAAKGIAEIITGDGLVNVDFADVRTVMRDSGVALMGTGRAGGENRAKEVADMALNSPLLNHNYIDGAKNVLINITSGNEEISLNEVNSIIEYIQQRSGNTANIIYGAGYNSDLGSEVEVTLIATGFEGLTPGGGRPQGPEEGLGAGKGAAGSPFGSQGGPLGQQGDRHRGIPVGEKNRTLKLPDDKRFEGIDKIAGTPAFMRHGVKFSLEETARKGAVEVRTAAKSSAKDDPGREEEAKKPGAPSLFD